MKVPSKKPPATPTVQLLTCSFLPCSPMLAAVVRRCGAACATSNAPGWPCATHGYGPAARAARSAIRGSGDRRMESSPHLAAKGSIARQARETLFGIGSPQHAGTLIPLACLGNVGTDTQYLQSR